MRTERIQSELASLSDGIKKRWSKLSSSDITRVGSDLKSLSSIVAKRYGLPMSRARAEVAEFETTMSTSMGDAVHAVGEAATDLFRNGSQGAVDAARKGGEKAAEFWDVGQARVKKFGAGVQGWIQSRPMTALAIAAGTGAALSLYLFRRRS